uniref:Uncharacterized protein n=1 Tax=Trichobilharzia regenti TaxID=157069 RepID=A0AA85KJ30_TRIRE|nr:unnamed protein product [Trichobilharzia regenti]
MRWDLVPFDCINTWSFDKHIIGGWIHSFQGNVQSAFDSTSGIISPLKACCKKMNIFSRFLFYEDIPFNLTICANLDIMIKKAKLALTFILRYKLYIRMKSIQDVEYLRFLNKTITNDWCVIGHSWHAIIA